MLLTPDQADDLVATVLPHFPKGQWVDIAMSQPDYLAPRIINEKNVQFSGGVTINFPIQTRNNGTARNTGLWAKDEVNQPTLMVQGSVPWSIQTVNWSYDNAEPLFQSDEETIVDQLQVRDHAAMNSMVELDEENLWTSPSSPSDVRPRGFTYWIVQDTTTTGGFLGQNPSGHTAGAAGVDSATNTHWRNWAGYYATIDKPDFVTRTKKAMRNTNFKAPNKYAALAGDPPDREILTTEFVVDSLERLAEGQNDRLGPDVAIYMDSVTIARVPVSVSWWLDANTSNNPAYGINFKAMKPFSLRGAQMRRNPPKQAPLQHRGREVHTDNIGGFTCWDRRSQFVLCTA